MATARRFLQAVVQFFAFARSQHASASAPPPANCPKMEPPTRAVTAAIAAATQPVPLVPGEYPVLPPGSNPVSMPPLAAKPGHAPHPSESTSSTQI